VSDIVQDGMIVQFHYTLKNDTGELIDSSTGGDPLSYLHGASNIVPGLERQLAGKAVGDKLDATVPPNEGYGKRQGDGPQAVPRDAFPEEFPVAAGMQFVAQSPEGERFPLWITSVEDDQVYVDRNHPLAGETLHFDVEITGIREATEQEQAHGHPHGPDDSHE
jgi:FKBP-type peptidyl-prolyl cis-trans isomerase SlyD